MASPAGVSSITGAENNKNLMNKWTNERLITGAIGHIPRFSEEKFAIDLEKLRLWRHVTGLSVSGNRRIMEVELDDVTHARTLLDGGLNTHGRTLQFREATTKRMTVSLLGVPLGFPMQEINDVMTCYGPITDNYRLTKTIHGRNLPTGTVIIKYDSLDEAIPKNIDIADRRIRTIYTGQDRHLEQWRQIKALQTKTNDNADNQQRTDDDTPDTAADAAATTAVTAATATTAADTITGTETSATRQNLLTQTSNFTEDDENVGRPAPGAIETPSTPEVNRWYKAPETEDMEITTSGRRKRNKESALLSDSDQPTVKNKQPQGNNGDNVAFDIQLCRHAVSDKDTESDGFGRDKPPPTEDLSLDQIAADELLTEIRENLKPGSADLTEIVNFIRSNTRNYNDTKELVETITGLTVLEEIYEFVAIVLYKGNGHFSKEKLKQNDDYPDQVFKEWQKLTKMKHGQINQRTKMYTSVIHEQWKDYA